MTKSRATAILGSTVGLSLTYLLVGIGCGNVGDPDVEQSPAIEPGQLEDYVQTPAWLYHKSCVGEIEEGAMVDEQLQVRRIDGSIYQLPECDYPSYPTRKPSDTETLEPTVSGWVENGYRYNGAGYKQFNADWYVPASPTTNGGLVYFFPGFEPDDYTRILQPVLQWGSNGGFGGNMWTIASWSCAKNSCFHSTPHQTWPNHHIYGKITGSSCSGGACNWNISTTDADTSQSPNIGWQAHVAYTRGYVALEAYGIDTCHKYPSGPRIWMNTSVWRTDGSLANGAWSAQYTSVSPGCSQNVVLSDASAVGLYWSH